MFTTQGCVCLTRAKYIHLKSQHDLTETDIQGRRGKGLNIFNNNIKIVLRLIGLNDGLGLTSYQNISYNSKAYRNLN